jgi:hypothetical protein
VLFTDVHFASMLELLCVWELLLSIKLELDSKLELDPKLELDFKLELDSKLELLLNSKLELLASPLLLKPSNTSSKGPCCPHEAKSSKIIASNAVSKAEFI